MPIDHQKCRELLEEAFAQAEAAALQGSDPAIDGEIGGAFDAIFRSATQAYREVLVGCTLARLQDRAINIRQPYAGHGSAAFNGRTLDEEVINPFLQDKRIPSSRGPYLNVFRRSVQFDVATRSGLRDKRGYDSLLSLIYHLESLDKEEQLKEFLYYLMYRFVQLRESAVVPLSRLHRISLEQYDALISGLLSTASGGRLPVLLLVATFKTIKDHFGLDWEVTWQGINVADTAAGVGGDITIMSGGQLVMAAEVTERPLDRSRVVATFNVKIAPAGITDYLFFVRLRPDTEVMQQARLYFSQGHEINFLEIKSWILASLATIGSKGRATFNNELLRLLDAPDMPRVVKMKWNEQIANLVDSQLRPAPKQGGIR